MRVHHRSLRLCNPRLFLRFEFALILKMKAKSRRTWGRGVVKELDFPEMTLVFLRILTLNICASYTR